MLGLMTSDAILGFFYRTGVEAKIEIIGPRVGVAQRAIVIFPGYVMPGTIVGKAFAPYIQEDDALVVVTYAERGIDPDGIYDKVSSALFTLKPTEVILYGASMGGMLAKLIADRYQRAGVPFGKLVIILDSAPAERADVKRPGWLFDVGCWYHGGPLSTALWATVSYLGGKPPTEPDVDLTLVQKARLGGAWAGMPAATTQGCFIGRFQPLIDSELTGVARRVIYMHGKPPSDDPIIQISQAITHWQTAFPELMDVAIEERPGRWHLPLVERPRETVEKITADY